MDVENAAPEQLEGLTRVVQAAHPVPGVGAGADAGVPAVDVAEDGLGQVVFRGRGMVVDGDLDVVFLDQLLEQREVVVGRLADDDPDAHLAGEIEDLAHARLGRADVDDAVAVERDAACFQGFLGEGDLLVCHGLVETGAGELGRQGLAGEGLDRGDAELLELGEGLDERELAEGPGLGGEGEALDADAPVVGLGHRLLELGGDVPDLRGGLAGRPGGRRGDDDQGEDGDRAFHGTSWSLTWISGSTCPGPPAGRSSRGP